VGLFGKTVTTQSGDTVTVDEAYVRESILQPSAKIAAGYQPIMPTFQGLVSEEQLLQLIEYVKSLKTQPEVPTARPTPAGPAPGEATPVKK
jgi:cytochrome c oxidase subunit 2